MKKPSIKLYFFLLSTLLLLGACSKDDDTVGSTEFVVAFEKKSLNFSAGENTQEIKVVFSNSASQNGTLQVLFQTNNLDYGTDFTTVPPAENGIIALPIEAGNAQTSFVFNKITANPTESEPEKTVEFSFGQISVPNGYSQGNTTLLVTYSEGASLGGSFAPNVGGPNEPNQVYVDLSAQTENAVLRNKWDLGFYAGEEFRVKLNASMYMMAAELQATDIDAVTANAVESLQEEMAFLVPGSDEFVDAPSGDLNGTAIAEIAAAPEENKVYLLKMGNKIGTETPTAGGVAVAGEERGWKKIRVLREAGGYVLQYADLNATTHQEISISKNEAHNFSFFSFKTQNTVEIEPLKENWDLNFTVFTEVEELPSGGMTAYGFSDYVKTNVLAETKAYRVSTNNMEYDSFSMDDVAQENFEADQRTIGSSWRKVTPPDRHLVDDIFYILQDADGNVYKLKFTALTNENGVRGHPKFEYELL